MRLSVQPERISLSGKARVHGVVVTAIDADGQTTDVTRLSTFESGAPDVITVDARGGCHALADGASEVRASFGGKTATVNVVASGTGQKSVPSFKQEILPILTKTGCNAGGCHGKLSGQNGFRLSLRGYAPEWDHDWLTKEVNARRINFAFPEESLLVQKPVGGVMHEGGVRFKPNSRYYQTLVDWVAARAPGPLPDEPDVARLEVLPGDRELRPGQSQQLLVRAHYPDGKIQDVTWLAQFFSNDEATLSVKPDGLVKAMHTGETSVRVHFQGQVAVVRFTMPYPVQVADEPFRERNNGIDDAVFAKLKALHVPPSPPCDDATFIRRAFLDTIGTLPKPDEVAGFLSDTRPDKRAQLVEALLARPEWVDYWTLQLADLLQNRKERDHDVRGVKGVRAFHAWLRAQVAENKPWSEIARSVLLAKGDAVTNPAIGYFVTVVGEKQNVEESELPDSAAQSFLGTRIGCARCHNHPLERYTQDDFYHFSAFFAKVRLNRVQPENGATSLNVSTREEDETRKRLAEAEEKSAELRPLALAFPGLDNFSKPLAEQEKKIAEARKRLDELVAKEPSVNQPRTNQRLTPQTLDHTPWTFDPNRDPREQLVEWILNPRSEYFSGAMVNRLWKHFFSVGLVEPVDDLRASNPSTNVELWAWLNREFVGHGYDLKHVMRVILNSHTYQLGSETITDNEQDQKFFSHYYARRLPAEVLSDAVADATGTPTKYAGYPLGFRAIQLPEPGVSSYFLTLFGRSDRVTACACERKGEVTLPQLLHLQNSEEIQRQIQDGNGRLTALVKDPDDAQVTREIFFTTVNRPPTDAELGILSKELAADKREDVFRDLFWALLNSKEFAFNH
ncbi:DUF1549 domain-containing protein [Verrucomicrobiota bacterium sgz303538]